MPRRVGVQRGVVKAGGGVGGTLVLSGFKELKAALDELPGKLEKKVIRKALRAGAKVIQKQAKANVPVKTGKLKKAIKVRAGKKRKKGLISVLVQVGAGDFKGTTFYGGPLEYGYEKVPVIRLKNGKWGSAPRGTKPTTTMAPLGFMRRAFDTKQKEATDVIARQIRVGATIEAKSKKT